MNPHDATLPPACADDAALEALVSGTLAPDRERALEAHLGGCAACRSRLDALAASPENWSTVREQLSAGVEADGEDAAPPIPALASLIQKILAPSDDDRMLGRLGPYEITGIIGSGGMGIVLKGHDRALDRFVAIKLLSPHLASSGAARQRFLREAKAAAAVVHDNVIAIHGVDEFAGLPYLVMPYCRGTTLEKRIRDAGPMTLREILRVGLQTARGLAAAHAQGLVHRDVKPANILLEDGVERVRITDFGLARAADDASLTVTGLLAGTPHYMSPEQALGKPLDARSDLFALGAVLFTMATGSPPFRAETSHAVLRMVTDVEPADVRLANPDMPPWLAAIIGRLLAKDPTARFSSATEVAGMLEACLAHVNDPLAIPLPPEVVHAAPSKPSPVAPAPDHQATPRTFLDSLRRIMSDQRLLSIAALVIFLMALLLPWPIMALGRAEPAIVYAVIATLTSLLFAWLGRRDSLGQLVLKLAGTAAILGGAVVAFWLLSDSVLSGGRHNAERVAAIRAENLAKQAQMEAMARQPNASVTIAPMSIPVPATPPVASGPDPMPVVGWPSHNAPAEMPVLTATVPANALPTVDPLATPPTLPPAAGNIAPIVPVEPQRVDLPVPVNPELLPTLPTLPPSSDLPAANPTRALVLPPEGDLPPPVDGRIVPAVDWDIIRQQWESNLEMTDEWLADARTVARGRMTVRERVIDEPLGLEVWQDSFKDFEFGPDEPPAAERLLSIDSPTNWQKELTTAFRGRSVMSIIEESGVRQVVEAGNTITVTTDPEPGDGYEQRFRFTFDRETGAIQAKSHEVRFRRAGPFQRMNLTRAGDFRLVASGVPLPHRITVEHSDLISYPADEIAPLARSISIDIAEWKPSPEGTEEGEDPQDPAEEWSDDESPEDADKPESETEESESIDKEQEAPEANQVGVDQADIPDDRLP